MKKSRRALWVGLTLLLCLTFLAVPVSAKTKKRINKWDTTKANNTYYYNQKGKRAKGFTKIRWHYYYFDEKGIQRFGWQKINGNYYYFRMASAKKGYSVYNRTVNGIRLAKDGKAKVTSANREKLELMVRANKLMQSLTNNRMSREQKLRVAFNQARNGLRAYNRGSFVRSESWDVYYAKLAFDSGRADCYSFGAYFAYLANAVGFRASCVSSGGHGWAEIDGKVYDPNWSLVDRAHDYFGMSYSLSGTSARIPNYARNRVYVKTI